MFHSLPGSAWADGKLEEVAEQLGKIVEHLRTKSTQPNYSSRWTTLYFVFFLQPSNLQVLNNFLVCPIHFKVQYIMLHPVSLTYTLTKKKYDMLRLCVGCKSTNTTNEEDISICRRDMLSK